MNKGYQRHDKITLIKKRSAAKNIWLFVPVIGALVFIALYLIAAFLYPGGSQADKNSAGFSWMNNYWCNLLNETAINGQHNNARPFAVAAMFTLCFTFSLFWFLFPKYAGLSKKLRLTIQIPGILAMVFSFLLLTSINHDLTTNLASASGIIATAGTFAGLYRIRWFGFLYFGLLNILLVLLNNYFYYSKELIVYLPVIQKISFVFFLTWVSLISINLYHLVKRKQGTRH